MSTLLSKCSITIVLLVIFMPIAAQAPCSFEQFSTKNGLTENRINYIIQDKHGFIWLGTFNGLIRYDGYKFKTYKVNTILTTSNRVDRIIEDNYGRLWTMAKDNILCFNPSTETFLLPQRSINFDVTPERVYTERSGKVWLVSKDEGCVCIKDSLFNYIVYSQENGHFPDCHINDIYEDKERNTWILSSNGIGLVTPDEMDSIRFIMNNTTTNLDLNKPFYYATEIDNEIWFGSNSGSIWRYLKKTKSFVEFKLDTDSPIRAFYKPNGKVIIILTQTDGFYTYNKVNGEIDKYNTTTLPLLDDNKLDYVYINKPNEMLFTVGVGDVFKFDLNTKTLKRYSAETMKNQDAFIYNSPFIKKDIYNQLWIHPRGGGFSRYNRKTDQLESLNDLTNNQGEKYSDILYSSYCDKQGILWMCTTSLGLEKITFCKDKIESQKPVPNSDDQLANSVRFIYTDRKGKLWLSTREGKLLYGDANLQHLQPISPSGKLGSDMPWPAVIYSIAEDANNNIWLGTRGAGLFKLSATESGNFSVENYRHNHNEIYSITSNDIYSIAEDHNNNIWIGTLGGGVNLITKTDNNKIRFLNYNNQLKQYPAVKCNRVRCIVAGPNNLMYAGTSGGLVAWQTPNKNFDNIEFNLYESQPSDIKTIRNNEIMGLTISLTGELYLATFGGGLNMVSKKNEKGFPVEFSAFNQINGLPSVLLLNTLTDKEGNIWMNSESGIARFNPTDTTFEYFKESKLLLSDGIFSEGAYTITSNNEILFGHTNGIIRFKPEQIKKNTFIPKIVLSNFRLYNMPFLDKAGNPIAINEVKKLELKYNQNFFSIDFTALDFAAFDNINYAYKLEGFDHKLNYTNDLRRAVYTNLPAGKYVFRVRSTNSSGVWVNNERLIPIIIQPSFWKTPWAYTLYTIALAGLFFIILWYYTIIYKLKNDVKFQKEIADIKLKFFTDISHEIRTPLTLITSPIEYLLDNEQTPKQVKDQLKYISQNTNRLLKLVNQILDFRKYQNQKLRIEKINLGKFTEKICREFTEPAKELKLKFHYTNLSHSAVVWADRDALEKVILNLLSNALKYNKPGNSIKVKVEETDDTVSLSVWDDGPGIPKSKQKKLFNRFSTFHQQSSNPSTGIGLSIIKEIVDKHHAHIDVESDEGQGSRFTIQFLTGYNHFGVDTEIIIPQNPSVAKTKQNKFKTTEPINDSDYQTASKPSILIVEDDDGLRDFITTILIDDFKIYKAENGKDGLESAIKHAPDFIVSDIMMPKMDGIELLKALRENVNTSHIPVILLTAKTTIESKIEGLTYGADDYITKPFSVNYFKARINNLLAQRKRLHQLFSADNNNQDAKLKKTSWMVSADEEFITKVIDIINKNITESGLTVEFLWSKLGLSRSTFFNKLKSLTGMSPVEFIRDMRLQNAAKLILEQHVLIKEACYMSGFSDLKYFGKWFKQKYGTTPGEYRKKS